MKFHFLKIFAFTPILSSKIIFTEKINNLPFKFFVEGGLSKRGWNGDNNAPELNGKFITSSLKFTKNQISKYFISLNYVIQILEVLEHKIEEYTYLLKSHLISILNLQLCSKKSYFLYFN